MRRMEFVLSSTQCGKCRRRRRKTNKNVCSAVESNSIDRGWNQIRFPFRWEINSKPENFSSRSTHNRSAQQCKASSRVQHRYAENEMKGEGRKEEKRSVMRASDDEEAIKKHMVGPIRKQNNSNTFVLWWSSSLIPNKNTRKHFYSHHLLRPRPRRHEKTLELRFDVFA